MADAINMAIPSPNATQHETETRSALLARPDVTAQVIGALRDGLGVEDIHARQIADIEFARDVVRKLKRLGLLTRLYRRSAAA